MAKVCTKCGIEKPVEDFRHRSSRCWDCLKKILKEYKKTDAGKLSAKNTKERNREKYRSGHNERGKKRNRELTDSYVVGQLMSRGKYAKEYILENPQLIEIKRVQILNSRIKRKIEDISEMGVCVVCKKWVNLNQFRTQRATEKKPKHIQRVCTKCRKEYNKKYWAKNKK